MADFCEVPVIEIHRDNFQDWWSPLLEVISNSSFVAIDTELSGLGNRRLINARDIDERYKGICEVAKSRSIISLGLSCFQLQSSDPTPESSDPTPDPTPGPSQPDSPTPRDEDTSHMTSDQSEGRTVKAAGLTFRVQTYNILILCSDNYVVEPVSLRFLVEHGFDFNKQYALGLPYHRGNDKPVPEADVTAPEPSTTRPHSVRDLFAVLVRSGTPLVFHNALVDLIFLYQNFYASTPGSMSAFLADLCEMWSGGVYDTKYLTEFKARMTASYLEYVFRKSQRENLQNMYKGWSHVKLCFPEYPTGEAACVVLPCGLQDKPLASQIGKTKACENFAAFGWCRANNSCPNSHDIDFILDNEDCVTAKKRRKRQKQRQPKPLDDSTESMELQHDVTENTDDKKTIETENNGMEVDSASEACNITTVKDSADGQKQNGALKPVRNVSRTAGHRAGFDAFMTGFAFAYYVAKYGKYTCESASQNSCDFGVSDYMNKITLSGKDIPLQIMKSNFAKTSKDHREKMERLKSSQLTT